MKKWILGGVGALVLGIAALVSSHTSGDTKSVQFIDGSTLKCEVGYFGAGGWGGLMCYAANYLGLGTTNGVALNVLTNNLTRLQIGAAGEQTFYSGNYPEMKREGHSLAKSLTDNTATNMFALALASNTSAAIRIPYGIVVTDATDMQHYTGIVTCRGTNKAAAFTVSCTNVADGSGTYATSGTLTPTWAISSANPAQITLTSDSSLTPTSTMVYYGYHNLGAQDLTVN